MSCVDAKLFKVFDRGRAKQVTPNSRHHKHFRAAKPSSNRLIRAFAPESKIEFLAEDCFPGLRELIGEGRQIDVGTSNHCDARATGHSFSSENLENAESIWLARLCQRRRNCVRWSC